jgi:hypothetical protein
VSQGLAVNRCVLVVVTNHGRAVVPKEVSSGRRCSPVYHVMLVRACRGPGSGPTEPALAGDRHASIRGRGSVRVTISRPGSLRLVTLGVFASQKKRKKKLERHHQKCISIGRTLLCVLR